jgi:hypothetical protein
MAALPDCRCEAGHTEFAGVWPTLGSIAYETERRVMGRGRVAFFYKQMSPENQRAFNRWLKANAILGSIFTAGIIAMAVAGSMSAGPRDAALASTTSVSGGAMPEPRRRPMGGVVTIQEPKIRQKLF